MSNVFLEHLFFTEHLRWNLASSAGKPKQTLDCINFIQEQSLWWSTNEPFRFYFYLQQGKKNILRQHIYLVTTSSCLNNYWILIYTNKWQLHLFEWLYIFLEKKYERRWLQIMNDVSTPSHQCFQKRLTVSAHSPSKLLIMLGNIKHIFTLSDSLY